MFDFIQEISNFKPVMPNRDKNKSLKYLFNNIKKIIYAHTKFRVSNLLSCTTFSNLFIKKISNLYYSNNDFAVIAIKLQGRKRGKKWTKQKSLQNTYRL